MGNRAPPRSRNDLEIGAGASSLHTPSFFVVVGIDTAALYVTIMVGGVVVVVVMVPPVGPPVGSIGLAAAISLLLAQRAALHPRQCGPGVGEVLKFIGV